MQRKIVHYPTMRMDPHPDQIEPDRVGLCARCRHARQIAGARSRFWLCSLSADNPAYPRYPSLPVRRCAGFTPGDPAG